MHQLACARDAAMPTKRTVQRTMQLHYATRLDRVEAARLPDLWRGKCSLWTAASSTAGAAASNAWASRPGA